MKADAGTYNHWEVILSLKERQNISLGSEMERQAIENPDKVAFIYEDLKITYDQLNRMSNRYAHFFLEKGLKKGDVVALLMDNRPEYLIATTGLSKIGVITSLINTVIRGERLAHAINTSEARAIIIGYELIEVFNSIVNGVRLKSPALILTETSGANIELAAGMQSLDSLLNAYPEVNPSETGKVNSEDTLVYMETAGSSGLRKVVAITHKRWLIMGNQFAMLTELKPESVQYLCLPLYYNMGFNICFSTMIISGCTMVIKPRFSVGHFWNDIRSYQVTHFMAVGEMLRYICEQPEKPDDKNNSIKYIVGNSTRGDIIIPLHQRFGVERIFEVYATTEGVGTFVNEEEISGMCGNLNFRGLRQGEIVQYDFENEQLLRGEDGWAVKCKPGQSGILLGEINELNAFPGYVNEPEASEAKISRNVFCSGDQYFNTGDLLQLHENDYISFIDRLGDTYRWKSKTVSATQVADVLNKFFGGIDEAFVYGVKIPGMEGRCGMAAIKLLEDVPLDWKNLVDHINRRMPNHARPVFVRICNELDAASFKRLKKQLQREGFDPHLIKDLLYFYDIKENAYLVLTPEKYQQIVSHKIKI